MAMSAIVPLWMGLVLGVVGGVWGHGFLRDPPGRSSMWLFGYNSPANYQHMELFCGGFPVSPFQTSLDNVNQYCFAPCEECQY